VLAGFVVTAPASRTHLRLGAGALRTRGSGGARLVVSGHPFEPVGSLVEAGRRLGPRLVARSSTLLEGSGEWAGAFTSYVDVTPEELPKAVVGCWASAFSVHALERQAAAGISPGSFPMAVLVQPALEPEWGGVAELNRDDSITVHGVTGSPAPLLQGWVTGETRHRSADGRWDGPELLAGIGVDQLDELHSNLRRASELLGVDRCEWAVADGRVWLLQLDTLGRPEHTPAPTIGGGREDWLPVVRSLLAAPGQLGAELILPWGLKGIPEAHPRSGVGPQDLREAMGMSRMLTGQVWGRDPAAAEQSAQACLDGLLGPEPERSLMTIRGLGKPDPGLATELMALVHGLRHEAAARGAVPSSAAAWYLTTEQIAATWDGDGAIRRNRIGPTRWEPLVAAVVLAHGTRHQGVSAAPGLGAGRLDRVGTDSPSPTPRSVVYSHRALPVLSQILWDASGLVTNAGSPAAHLFESARSLGVAAVTGIDLPGQDGLIVAVDGFAGVVATIAG
jgi:hypothetical protein